MLWSHANEGQRVNMRLAITTAGLAAALLAAPAAAPAAVTCDYSSAGKLLTVSLSAMT